MKHLLIILITTMLTWNLSSFAVDNRVIGIVTDALSGQPLVGVNIQVLGSKKGAVTDLNGAYSLLLETHEKVLIFSYTGYVSQRIKVAHQTTINVQLSQKGVLSEVAVEEAEMYDQSRPSNNGIRKVRQGAITGVYQGVPTAYPEPNWNTEDYDFIVENGFISTGDQETSTFSVDVDRASYSNMRRFLMQGSTPPPDAVRIEEMINYFEYSYSQPDSDHPVAITYELGSCPWQVRHQLLQIGVQSKKLEIENLPASNLVFLIDVSGSMQYANKLPLLIESFRLLVGQLRPQDRVSIVTYAGSSAIILQGKSGQYKEEIIGALEKLQAGGSTAGARGILTAYDMAKKYFIKGGNNRVILATDGDFNIGVSSDGDLVRLIEKKRESGVFLSVLGFGVGNYKDNKMQKLADHGNGNHNYIDNLTEAKKVFVNEFGGNLYTVAKDVKIQLEFNPVKVAGYRLIGYENRKLENRDFSDDKKDAGEMGAGHMVTALYEIIPIGTESEWIVDVDKRYTDSSGGKSPAFTDELAYIKLRYKDPENSVSELLEQPIKSMVRDQPLSDNFRWAAAVAGFGMVLRDSEFKQDTDVKLILQLAEQSKDQDLYGYRDEFIFLIHQYMKIQGVEIAEEEVINNK